MKNKKLISGILIFLGDLVLGWVCLWFFVNTLTIEFNRNGTVKKISIPKRTVMVYNPDGKAVAKKYKTIQEGVDVCLAGGTVSVSAETYMEAVYINKGIALVGVGTPTIDPPSWSLFEKNKQTKGNAVTFKGTSTDNALISGFTITDADIGIYCSSGSPTITNNIISGNNNCGIFCIDSSPTIIKNTIVWNLCGISCWQYSPTIVNNTITGNKFGISYWNSSSTIANNTISENGYGIYLLRFPTANPTIINNTMTGNVQSINCYESFPTIAKNTITGNGTMSSQDYYGCPKKR